MSDQREWIIISLLVFVTALLAGVLLGWNARGGASSERYLRALVEKHEATAHYWDVKTNEILTNNTLERKGNGTKKD